jgi:hypothetical protein
VITSAQTGLPTLHNVRTYYIGAHMSDPLEPVSLGCTVCYRPMRLQTIEPAYFYSELVECTFTCECGQSAMIYTRVTLNRMAIFPAHGRRGCQKQTSELENIWCS